MVQISQETPEQIEKRLLKVIAESEIKVYAGTFVFDEFPLSNFPGNADRNALALVRDNEVWSQLVPSTDKSKELFVVFSFHFEGCSDNSGFVGWLASHLKCNLGTGVFVTCGQNTKRGGIFDYWGCPAELYDEVTKELEGLISKGKKLMQV